MIEPTGAQAGLAVALGERLAEAEREPLSEGEAAAEAVTLGGLLREALREADTLSEAATDAVAATEAPGLRETLGEAAREPLSEADGERDQEPLCETEKEEEREAEGKQTWHGFGLRRQGQEARRQQGPRGRMRVVAHGYAAVIHGAPSSQSHRRRAPLRRARVQRRTALAQPAR